MNPAVQLLVERIHELGLISDEPGHLTRTFLSPAMLQADALVGKWMTADGMDVRVDSTGNLIGRLKAANPAAKTLLLAVRPAALCTSFMSVQPRVLRLLRTRGETG